MLLWTASRSQATVMIFLVFGGNLGQSRSPIRVASMLFIIGCLHKTLCRPGLWHRAKKMALSQGQTEVKIEFPLPIVACNLMIEYADFYDNVQASAETLQCPRCSASVPANPGVCGNCGENVFQCHKCR
jgi:hypothetical protein